MLRTGEVWEWQSVDLISGGLTREAFQATMTNALLIIFILNLESRIGALLSLQFHRNMMNMDMKKS